MARVIKTENVLVVDDDNLFIEQKDIPTKLTAYFEDDTVYFRVLDTDGIKRFYITSEMAKELVQQLNQRLEKNNESN